MSTSIEDQILGKNSEPELYSEDIRYEEAEDNDALEDIHQTSASASPSKVPFIPNDRPGPSSGPKGVLADYRAHQRELRIQKDIDAAKLQDAISRVSIGVQSDAPSVSYSATYKTEYEQLRREMAASTCDSPSNDGQQNTHVNTDEEHDTHEDELDDDEEFMRSYFAKRKAQLQAQAANAKYGSVLDVADGIAMVDAIDATDKHTYVVVHLYETFNRACRVINEALNTLAQTWPHVKFIRVVASKASPNGRWDPIGLPTFIVYKGGDTLTSMLRVSDDIGETPSSEDIEWFLSTKIPAIVSS